MRFICCFYLSMTKPTTTIIIIIVIVLCRKCKKKLKSRWVINCCGVENAGVDKPAEVRDPVSSEAKANERKETGNRVFK